MSELPKDGPTLAPRGVFRRLKIVRSIQRNNSTFGQEFQRALSQVVSDQGLTFFTDEQLEQIRAEMVQRWWLSHRINRENRRRAA